MPLAVLYHPEGRTIVKDDETKEFHDLMASGWYDHPTKAKNAKEKEHEESIRQQPKPRRSNGKRETKAP